MSPERVAQLSHGEVTKSVTVDAVTLRPIVGGLCCPKIFGPYENGQCHCGKYKKAYHLKGHICEECGVEIGSPKLRRERFGHISLASPVVHVLFRDYISQLLKIPPKQLADIIVCKKYIVLKQGDSTYKQFSIISSSEYFSAKNMKGFKARCGAEVLRLLLRHVNLEELAIRLKNDKASRRKISQLKAVSDLLKSSINPEWMILDAVLVMPAGIRPVIQLQDGTVTSSDLNELYSRVIIRNNRLKRLIALQAPEVMINLQKAALQQAVDALFYNGKTCNMTDRSGKRKLKSIIGFIKGKEGRIRKNLLGKRVDFSARSQITVGPELKLHQCALPYRLAMDLARPFVYHELLKLGYAISMKHARKLVELNRPEAMEALERVLQDRMVLLNRAPSLHRMSFQAFDPVLIPDKTIRLHPLVCSAFNADFDGDQMGVHLPLSNEAQIEARVLMSSVNNIISPANGNPLVTPSQDALFGIYYLTKERDGCKGEGIKFADKEDVITAHEHGAVEIHSKIKMRHESKMIETTPGRVILSDIFPENIPFEQINKPLKKKDIAKLIEVCFYNAGPRATVAMVDKLKDLGFKYSTISGLSINMDDMRSPKDKWEIIKKAENAVNEVEQAYKGGLLEREARYKKIIEIWGDAANRVKTRVMEVIGIPQDEEAETLTESQKKDLKEFNSLWMMADSGARGNVEQINAAAGMCGLMPKPSGEVLESPIKASLAEGLSYHEYLLLVHKGRKGRIDTPTKTPIAGYFTRRLIYAMQDVIIEERDCGSQQYIEMKALYDDNDEVLDSAADRAYGRLAAKEILHPETHEIIVRKGQVIGKKEAEVIKKNGVRNIFVRSPLICEAKKGICAACYGLDLSTSEIVEIGTPVGIIAAQSIGEPGTQLTLRTFHNSGASVEKKKTNVKTKDTGTVVFENIQTIKNREEKDVVISKNGFIVLVSGETEKARWKIPYAATLEVQDGAQVNEGDTLANWDSSNTPILSTIAGTVKFKNINSKTMAAIVDENGIERKVITAVKDIVPIVIVGETEFIMPSGAYLNVKEGDVIEAGDIVARVPGEALKNVDITSGLPKVLQMLDLKKPKNKAILAEINGYIYIETKGDKYIISIDNKKGDKRHYSTPLNSSLTVFNGDYVNAGDVIVEGDIYPADLIRIFTPLHAAIHIVNEVQKIYKGQGVSIHDKHFEILTRKMTDYVQITNPGNTDFISGDIVLRKVFADTNNQIDTGKASGMPIVLGLKNIALYYPSWLSAASFQNVVSVLSRAAIRSDIDPIEGIVENVIIGKLIPAGTGHKEYLNTFIKKRGRGRPKKNKLSKI